MVYGARQTHHPVPCVMENQQIAEAAEVINGLDTRRNKDVKKLARYLKSPLSSLKERGPAAQKMRWQAQSRIGSLQALKLPAAERESIGKARNILRQVFSQHEKNRRKLMLYCMHGFAYKPADIRKKATTRLFKCYKDLKCKRLDLSCLSLDRLPLKFPGLGHVRAVDLTGNKFTSVPCFPGMPRLKFVGLDHNKLLRSPSPEEIGSMEVSFLHNQGAARELSIVGSLCNINDEGIPVGLPTGFVVKYVKEFLSNHPDLPLSPILTSALGSLNRIVDIDEEQAIERLQQGENLLILAGWQGHAIVFHMQTVPDTPNINILLFNAGEGC